MFKRKKVSPPDEVRNASEYVAFKDLVHNGRQELTDYVNWLESELEEKEKLWANFHRFFAVTYMRLRSVLPDLKKIEEFYREDPKPYEFSKCFRVRCPFDEDSYYVVQYSKEKPVDIDKIPEEFYAPHDIDIRRDKEKVELTEEEYIALFLYGIIKDNLEKVKKLLEFDDDPLGFSVKMMAELGKRSDSRGLELWTIAALYEQKAEKVVADVKLRKNNPYVKYMGI